MTNASTRLNAVGCKVRSMLSDFCSFFEKKKHINLSCVYFDILENLDKFSMGEHAKFSSAQIILTSVCH